MSTSPDYITEQEFNDYIKSKAVAGNAVITDAITAASRAIDTYCGRRFYTATETQYFRVDPSNSNFLWILDLDDMDIADTAGLTVTTTTGNDGTYPDAWTLGTDYIAEPVNQSQNGITGWPYTYLRAIGGRVWPINVIEWERPHVKIVSAHWGWAAVPLPVKQACRILTNQYMKLADAGLGVAGYGAFGDIKVKDIPQVRTLLTPYRKGGSWGIA